MTADAALTLPCCEHCAVQPAGNTCTIIRRAHCPQKRGGSSSSLAAHES